MKRPTFNHTRGDGPFDPCPECLELMSDEQLWDLADDRRERERAAFERVMQKEVDAAAAKLGMGHLAPVFKIAVDDLSPLPASDADDIAKAIGGYFAAVMLGGMADEARDVLSLRATERDLEGSWLWA